MGSTSEVRMLGHDAPLKWTQGKGGLEVELPDAPAGNYAYVLKITGK